MERPGTTAGACQCRGAGGSQLLGFCVGAGAGGRRARGRTARRPRQRSQPRLGGGGEEGGEGGKGGVPPRSRAVRYFDPDRGERPAWADALWSIFRFHMWFGMIYGLYAHLRIAAGLWTKEDVVPVVERRRRVLNNLQLLGEDECMPEALGPGLEELQALAESTLDGLLSGARRMGLAPPNVRVAVRQNVPHGQLAISLVDREGTRVIAVDGYQCKPSMYAPMISHELAHHLADHLLELQTLLFVTQTPFNAFKPLAPVLLLAGMSKAGQPDGASRVPAALQRCRSGLDMGVKLMFIDRVEVVERVFTAVLNPWRQRAELEADRIGAELIARGGFDVDNYGRLFNSLEKTTRLGSIVGKVPFLRTHPHPRDRREAFETLAPELRTIKATNRSGARIERRLSEVEAAHPEFALLD